MIQLNAIAPSTPNTRAGDAIIIDGDTPDTGVQLSWEGRGTVEIAALRRAWAEAGLEGQIHLPVDTTPHKALKIALDAMASRRVLVRPLGGRGDGFALVDESADADNVHHEQMLKAAIDKDGNLIVAPYYHPLAETVREEYSKALRYWTVGLLSEWLGTGLALRQLGGVALKERGGLFYIPPAKVETIKTVQRVLESVSDYALYLVPMVLMRDALRMVVAGALREATEAADKAAEAVFADGAGKGSLNTQKRKCDEMLAKLESYDGLLGDALETVKARIHQLRGSAVSALLLLDD